MLRRSETDGLRLLSAVFQSGNPILRGRVETFLAARPYGIRLHSKLKCDYPVAHGALLDAFREDKLPNKLHLFLSRHELYYPELHAWKANTHPAKCNKGAKEVHDCLASLIKYSSDSFERRKQYLCGFRWIPIKGASRLNSITARSLETSTGQSTTSVVASSMAFASIPSFPWTCPTSARQAIEHSQERISSVSMLL